MKTTQVTDPDDPRLRLYLRLKDRDVRRETGLFLAEGEHVVRRAFEAGLEVVSVLVVEGKAARVVSMAEAAGWRGVQILACSKAIMERATGIQLHQGIIAAVRPPAPVTVEQGLTTWAAEAATAAAEAKRSSLVGDGNRNAGAGSPRMPGRVVVVCPEITNVDNLGLLVRVSAGLGVSAMVLGPRCADPWYRRAVRVSMGAVFRMPIWQSHDMAADLTRLRTMAGLESVATVIDADAPALRKIDPRPVTPMSTSQQGKGGGGQGISGWAILLGSEGYGLPKTLVDACDRRVRIPMHHEVDSLNVAVAAGIVIHHFVQPPAGE